MLLAAPNARNILRLIGVERAANAECEELCVPADCVERRAQLVTHAGEELRLRSAGSEGFFLRTLSFLDVDCDTEPGIDLSRFVPAGATAHEKPIEIATGVA